MADLDKTYSGRFLGKRILIVEDGYFLSDEARAKLVRLGAKILGPVASVHEALRLVSGQPPDAAILDTQVEGEQSFAIAEKLEDLEIPYVFATGSDSFPSGQSFPGFILSDRPGDLEHIARALFGPSQNDA